MPDTGALCAQYRIDCGWFASLSSRWLRYSGSVKCLAHCVAFVEFSEA